MSSTRRTLSLLSLLALLALTLAGCGGGEQAAGGVPADAALKVTGNVQNEVGWTEETVRAMETIDAESTNKEGEAKTYTGVPINTLLDLAGVGDGPWPRFASPL